jgi:hypothetical protein
MKHACSHSEVLKKRTCALFGSLQQKLKVESGAWHQLREQQQQQQQ